MVARDFPAVSGVPAPGLPGLPGLPGVVPEMPICPSVLRRNVIRQRPEHGILIYIHGCRLSHGVFDRRCRSGGLGGASAGGLGGAGGADVSVGTAIAPVHS